MPFFPDTQNTNVRDSNLVDVRGDFHYYANRQRHRDVRNTLIDGQSYSKIKPQVSA
jgi:hypothetical protein